MKFAGGYYYYYYSRYFSEEDLNIHFRLEDPETSTTLAALNAELSFLPDERDCVKTLEALEGAAFVFPALNFFFVLTGQEHQ
jgi:hypothetical protein